MFVSTICGRRVREPGGSVAGRVKDLVTSPGERMPLLSAVVLERGRQETILPVSAVRSFDPQVVLQTSVASAPPYQIKDDDLLLRKDVLDKQIVDVHDYRVVRVNDVRLAHSKRGLRVVGVDIGFRGLMRRLAFEWVVDLAQRLLHRRITGRLISWEDVEPYERAAGKIRLKVPVDRLAGLHPADIGKIINELDPEERREVLESLDLETAAEALQEADPEVQVDIMRNMEDEKAADILEEMEPDEAADLLGDLPSDISEGLLNRMEQDDAEEVKELLAYDEHSAGGLMTNEFIAIRQDMTAEQTIQHLRELAPEAETIYYVYVVDEDERLAGVLSLRDLIVASPASAVAEFMVKGVIHVHAAAGLEDIAKNLGRYNLLALPVVDDEHRLLGIVTVDDALEQLLPTEWRRAPRADHK